MHFESLLWAPITSLADIHSNQNLKHPLVQIGKQLGLILPETAYADSALGIKDTQTGAGEFAIAFAVDDPNGNTRRMTVGKLL